MPARLLLIFSLIVGGHAYAFELQTQDGLALEITPDGRVAGLRLGGKACPLAGEGGFYVADVANVPCKNVQLVPNPSFEKATNRQPSGWEVGADWTLDPHVAHTGKASMHVRISGPQKRNSGNLAVEVPVQPNTPHCLSAWLKTAGGAPSLYIVQLDAQGRPHRDYPQKCLSHARRESDWFELRHEFVTASFCRRLRVYSNLWDQTGEAWLDDLTVTALGEDFVAPQQPARGRVLPFPGGLRQESFLRDQRLQLQATYRALANHLEISGELKDISGQNRAVTLSYRLPLAGAGWNWGDDLYLTQTIEPGIRYGAARSFGPRRALALYPFAALSGPKGGIALGVPMDTPRVFRLCYEQGQGFFIYYEFGLTPKTTKFPSSASFRFFLTRLDPRWGFRAAAEKYYRLFPQFFVRRWQGRAEAAGMQELEVFQNPEHWAPAAAIWDYHKRAARPAYEREGVRLYSYTEFAGWWGWAIGITPQQAEKQPSPEEAWAYVQQLAAQSPPLEPRQEVAQCIVNCAPYDRHGKPVLLDAYVPAWGGYNYVCNPDPEIEGLGGGNVNRYRLTVKREVAPIETFQLDGLYFDCVFTSITDNFREEHFRWADLPLAFDHETKRPCLPLAFSVYEAAKALSEEIHRRGLTVMSNYSVTDSATDPFCIQFIDLIGNEMLWTWTTDAKLGLQRVLAYQKPICMTWQEAKASWPLAQVERELKQALFFGTYYYLSTLPVTFYDRLAPLTQRLDQAGWRPIPWASVAAPAKLERFGDARQGNLHFTVRNPTEQEATVTLQLEAAPLQLSSSEMRLWQAHDAWTFEPLPVQRTGGLWTTTLRLPPNDTIIVRVATREQLAADMLLDLPPLLANAIRYRAALASTQLQLEAPPYEAILTESARLREALREGKGEAAALQALAARLTTPQAAGLDKEPALWLAYLQRDTARARRRLQAAVQILAP